MNPPLAEKESTPAAESSLIVNEIFYSLQGETTLSGIPTVFIRLTGCPLRCRYCDTAYAFHEGKAKSLQQILSDVGLFCVSHVTVTGGEPLAQKNCIRLLGMLCDHPYTVSLETGGALDISGIDPRVIRILDIKTPGSGEVHRNRLENVDLLTAHDQVKFVLCDRQDYDWAKGRLAELRLAERCEVLFSCSHGQLRETELAEWILADRLPVRFQLQLHKILWGNLRAH